jgi:hypothetical protein
MIKPKYPKRADISQIARLAVEHAVRGPLIGSKGTTILLSPSRRKKPTDLKRQQD